MKLQEILESRPDLLEKLRTRQLTNREVAAQLGYDEFYLGRVLIQIGVGKKEGEVRAKRKALSRKATTRKQFRTELAKQIVSNTLTLEKAAELARCSTRTMYRYVDNITVDSKSNS